MVHQFIAHPHACIGRGLVLLQVPAVHQLFQHLHGKIYSVGYARLATKAVKAGYQTRGTSAAL